MVSGVGAELGVRAPGLRREMSRKKISTTIYITPEQADRLKLLHERTKVPIAVFIREGIDLMLKHYEPVLPGQMSLDSADRGSVVPGAGVGTSGVDSTRAPASGLPVPSVPTPLRRP